MIDNKNLEMILLKQDNIRIEPSLDFDIDSFMSNKSSKFVVFYYDKRIQRNKYTICSIGTCKEEFERFLSINKYRGHVKMHEYGSMPLFVEGFDFPLYRVKIIYKLVNNKKINETFVSMVSPISFKLKNSENRLCFETRVKTYDDISNLLIDNWSTRETIKAFKFVVPLG